MNDPRKQILNEFKKNNITNMHNLIKAQLNSLINLKGRFKTEGTETDIKYSLFTVANNAYFPFVDILINSSLMNTNKNNLQKIYIYDIGLDDDYKKYLKTKDKVILIKSRNEKIKPFDGTHNEGWVECVSQKTLCLENLLKTTEIKETIILIDSDVCVLKDLSSSIDKNFDIQFTTMSDMGHVRSDNIYIREIGCYIIFNNIEASKLFLDKWILRINELKQITVPPYETPAMNQVIRDLDTFLNIGFLDENFVCSDQKIFDNSLSIHMKNCDNINRTTINNFENRISILKDKCISYLNKEMYNTWKDNINAKI